MTIANSQRGQKFKKENGPEQPPEHPPAEAWLLFSFSLHPNEPYTKEIQPRPSPDPAYLSG
ncbi:hypothetical protein B0O44_101217 [Pedobacter nutrimenti]|uniref:Uncharacterized protein n=1 Tax=Pedobacter nutrimenti TaxID=1241337 RepID=A0A318URP0_9SPHI|nr:hypothetical protein B0O44_101217 [Pedobacter nutrimenti]